MTLLLASTLFLAIPAVPRDYDFAGRSLHVDNLGVCTITEAGAPLVQNLRLWLAGPDWKSTDQLSASLQGTGGHDTDQQFTLHMTEPVSSGKFEITETVRPVAGGVEITYVARPLATMTVNELSIMADLPLATWKGKPAFLWPGLETAFPATVPAGDAHFASEESLAAVFNPGAAQVSVRFADGRRASLQDNRKFGGDSYSLFVQVIPSGATQVKPGDEFSARVTLLARDGQSYASPRPASVASTGPLAIRSVRLSAAQLPQFSLLDIRPDLSATYDNPFDPSQIDLRAKIQCPDGASRDLPAFYYAGYSRQLVGNAGVLMPTADAGWRVRFTPTLPGRYTFRLVATSAGKTVESRLFTFTATARAAHGFIRRSADSHYFRFDDDSPYFPVGENLCWYGPALRTYDYDRWLARLHHAGANYVRIWMPVWAFGIEGTKPNSFRLDRAWELDYVLAQCERLGIHVKLTLENFRTFDETPNPYDVRNGGPCKTVQDFFTMPEAKAQFKNRLRYLVARYSHSQALFAWELWNEINCVDGYDKYKPAVVAWSAEMARYLKEIDPNRHLTVNSLGSSYTEPDLWSLPEMDFAQMHGYYGWSGVDETRDMAYFVAKSLDQIVDYHKPFLFSEFGIIREQPEPRALCDKDVEGVHLHNGQWAAAMSGSAGGAMLWWWDDYVDPMNLYSRFASLSRFTQDVPWNKAGLKLVYLERHPEVLRIFALRGPGRILFWAQNPFHTWWNVVHEAKMPLLSRCRLILHDLNPGTYRLRLYDTWSGRYVRDEKVTPRAGKLEISLGDIPRDLAGKLELIQ
jgi:hypothetical protein